eukprot:scaffold7428_cov50-Prasinocladus_malaysianus.AAC.1
MPLDSAMGGGYPRGRIVEVCRLVQPIIRIYGPESSGKTTLALHAIAEVQKNGGTAALVDAEHAFEPVYAKVAKPNNLPLSQQRSAIEPCDLEISAACLAQNLGVNLDELLISQPFSGEDALNIVDRYGTSKTARHTPTGIFYSECRSTHCELMCCGGGSFVLLVSLVRSMAVDVIAVDSVAALVPRAELEGEIGQVQVGVIYGNPEVTSGGNALKFYASVAEFDINFGSGISHLGGLLDSAVAAGIISRKGAWYSYGETKLGMGKEKTMQYLTGNPSTLSEIEMETRAAIRGGKADPGYGGRGTVSLKGSVQMHMLCANLACVRSPEEFPDDPSSSFSDTEILGDNDGNN